MWQKKYGTVIDHIPFRGSTAVSSAKLAGKGCMHINDEHYDYRQ
jgi:hypothetical protein